MAGWNTEVSKRNPSFPGGDWLEFVDQDLDLFGIWLDLAIGRLSRPVRRPFEWQPSEIDSRRLYILLASGKSRVRVHIWCAFDPYASFVNHSQIPAQYSLVPAARMTRIWRAPNFFYFCSFLKILPHFQNFDPFSKFRK